VVQLVTTTIVMCDITKAAAPSTQHAMLEAKFQLFQTTTVYQEGGLKAIGWLHTLHEGKPSRTKRDYTAMKNIP
jgi:hypothetical protein